MTTTVVTASASAAAAATVSPFEGIRYNFSKSEQINAVFYRDPLPEYGEYKTLIAKVSHRHGTIPPYFVGYVALPGRTLCAACHTMT